MIEKMHNELMPKKLSNPLKIAKMLKVLAKSKGLSQKDLAVFLEMKRSTISNFLRLLTLPEDVQQLLEEDKISHGHAKIILSIKEQSRQSEVVKKILTDALTVKETELEVKGYKKSKNIDNQLFLDDISDKLEQLIGSRVTIQPKGEGGRIVIEYTNLDGLDLILEKMGFDP